MRFEIIRATKTAHWLRIVGHTQAFARIYTNAPGGRAICPELEGAARIAGAAPALLEALRAMVADAALFPGHLQNAAVLNAARAAIAAAEGSHA